MKNQDLILLDLFSGMGGFHLGLEEAGFNFKKVYLSEVDKHAIANYKYNFNEAEHIGSVEHILDSGIDRPNIITFGSPCQDFSLAGKRKGMDGDRSSLIEYAISSISHFRPDIYIWENVKGTFSSNAGEDFWAIIQAFANIGDYELEWQLVNTSWILPQNRERIYLVGHLTESFRDWKGVFPIEENDEIFNEQKRSNSGQLQTEHSSTIRPGYGSKADNTFIQCRKIAGCLTGGGNSGGLHSDMEIITHTSVDLKSVKSSTRGGMFKENQTHTLDTDCNLGVIQLNQSTESGGKQPYQHNRVYSDKGLCTALSTDARSPKVYLSEPTHKHGEERIYEDTAPTVQARYGTGCDNIPYVNYPPKEVKAVLTPDRANKRQNGRRMKEDGAPNFTITSQDIHGVAEDDNIRRLTEIECERLQGFPDDWTKWGLYPNKKYLRYIFGNNRIWKPAHVIDKLYNYVNNNTKLEVEQISKTQRYKMCGNAVTAKMVELIGVKILNNLER